MNKNKFFLFPAAIAIFTTSFLGICPPGQGAEVRFAGYATDTSEWQYPSAVKHPAGAASGMLLNGWSFFGTESPLPNFADPAARMEKLPSYVKAVEAAAGAKAVQFSIYAAIQYPGNREKQWTSGTVTVGASEPVDLLRIKLGKMVPVIFRIGLLLDNLDSPIYVPKELRIVIDGKAGDPAMTTGGAGIANNKPDWYFWDISGAKDGSEFAVRVAPNSGVAALGGVIFLSHQGSDGPQHFGEFSRDGEYMKDHYVFKKDNTFHLFYNVGDAGKIQDWQEPQNEKAFGHATSKDLKTWEHHPRVLNVVPGTWEGQVVSAPSIIKHGDTYYMFYTGFDDRVLGKQSIGLATSKDLFNWVRHDGNPVYEAPPWVKRNESGWLDCRDAHVIKHGNEFLLYTMVTTDKGEGALSLASSADLKNWKDLGPSLVTFEQPESPRVFEHKGTFYMFATSGHGKILVKSKDPKSGKWEEVPFRWPAPGLWSGWEVVEDGDRTIFSAFEWKANGNFIRFWEVDWDGETPIVKY